MDYSQNKWILREMGYGTYLMNESQPKRNEIIDARRLCEALGKNYSSYNFYCFGAETERKRFVFVSNAELTFEVLEEKWGTQHAGFVVEGALYDLNYHQFVTLEYACPTRDKFFYKFVIYDAGIPHIVYEKITENYVILSLPDNKPHLPVQETVSYIIPTTVTYLKYGKLNFVKRTRVIFFEKRDASMEYVLSFMVLDDDLRVVKSQDKAMFARCILGESIVDGEFTNMHPILYTKGKPFCKVPVVVTDVNASIVGGDTCVVVRSPFGEFGECILLLINGELFYNERLSFYDYEVITNIKNPDAAGHLVLKLYYEKSDLENGYFYYDVTDRKEYERIV